MSAPQNSPKRLAIGVVGIGRIGRQHALNALHHVSSTQLLCVCSPAQPDNDWANEHLVPHGVKVYRTFEEVIQEPGLEAVLIASITKLHKEQVIASIKAGKHVLCEKPLAMTSQQSGEVLAVARKPEHRNVRVMTGFSRRFDASYMSAVKAVKSGKIGQPVVIRSDTRDKYDGSEWYQGYIMNNPGIFIDTVVHDIDLTFAILGAEARPKAAYAVGNVALHKYLKSIQDVDNAVGTVEWYPVAEGQAAPISYYYASRIQKHGFDNPTEIIGTDGVLKINLHPHRDLIIEGNSDGIGNDVMPDFYERYAKAFVTELEVFADAILNERPFPYEIETAMIGMRLAEGLQESLRTGTRIEWDEDGSKVNRSKL